GVWVGNDDFSPMKKITGGSLPAQIWSGFMRTALKNSPHTHLPRAEPVPPFIAEDGNTPQGGDNPIQRGLDGIGNFFDHLFGGGHANIASGPASKDISPPPETSEARTHATPPAPPGETFVFENGETGERQVFQTGQGRPARQTPPLIP
ncbi:MAG TPA: hypothetical protein VGM72_03480, partial [Micropepsaceae bacterium]